MREIAFALCLWAREGGARAEVCVVVCPRTPKGGGGGETHANLKLSK